MSEEKKNDLKKVKELIELMVEKDLVEVEIVDGDSKIHLKRPNLSIPMATAAPMPMMMPAPSPVPATAAPASASTDDKLAGIKSPIIGTFYSAPSPDSPAYVKVGDHVTADTVVCIVEAMKVMNEIKAEMAGTVEKVMVTNGQTVEYGQVLFKVRPD